MTKTLRQKCEERLQALKRLRTDYEEEWFDIARFAQPSRSRFLLGTGSQTDNATTKRTRQRFWNKKLMDPHGIDAFRTLTNGMTSGLTSTSRPWFTLTLSDKDLLDEPGVRDWLSEVEKRMYAFLAGTNFYGEVKAGYGEMGLFGTEACVMLEHQRQGAVCHTLTAGEYWIACGDAGTPDVLYRRAPMTAREVVQIFREKAPRRARELYDKSQYTETIDIYQAIEPNADYDEDRFGSKPWRSVYWDMGDQKEQIISESGFMEQPFWAPRWDKASGDTYGSSPGMDCLPALRELQMQNKRLNEAIDALVKPEKIVPPSVKLTGQPGRIVSVSGITKDNVIVPYQMPYQAIAAINDKIMGQREQIDALSFADLFNAITNMRGIQPRTVEEIAARNEEKLTQLGPVIERVSNEKLEVVIERTYGIMLRGQMIPPVPEALSGVRITVEFVSILTQMQRMVGLGQIERTLAFVGNTAGVQPEVIDKINVDELVDEYADRAGAPPKIIRSEDEVKKMRDQRAQQQNMAQMAAMAQPARDGAEAARLLSEADSTGQSPMQRMTGQ